MRTIIGLCFLTATLTASGANAQSLFLQQGDPNTISATVGGGLMKEAIGGTFIGSYSYRGVFDLGVEFTFANFNAGPNNTLKGLYLMPFASMPIMREELNGLPFSVGAILGVNKHMMLGNGPVPGPDGWGVLAGPSFYKRLDLLGNVVLIPEILVAFDMDATRHYSNAEDQNSIYANPHQTTFKYDVRALVKANVSYKSGDSTYIFVPYTGYQGAFVVGAQIGLLL